MLYQKLPLSVFAPKYVFNGFPKSGLHLIVLMAQPVAKVMPGSPLHKLTFIGTFKHHSWSNEWTEIRPQLFGLSRLQQGHYFKAHCGYHDDLERMMYWMAAAHVFIYRDLRDVAVSQAHHILNEDGTRLLHPDAGLYRKLGGFDEVLAAVIEGVGPYPGIVDRWEQYAPWLESDWTHAVRFEDARSDPHDVAAGILEYGIRRISAAVDTMEVTIDKPEFDAVVEQMVEASRQTHRSPTYRKGEVGGWREAFTSEHVDLFKQCGGAEWLVDLGYEDDDAWGVPTEPATSSGISIVEQSA